MNGSASVQCTEREMFLFHHYYIDDLNFTEDFILVGAYIRCKILNHVCQVAEPIIVSKNQIKVQHAS